MTEFHTRLDAEWAEGLTYFQIPWVLYPRNLEQFDGQVYLPEFYLPDQHAFVHVLSQDPQMSFYDIQRYADAHPDAMIIFVEMEGRL